MNDEYRAKAREIADLQRKHAAAVEAHKVAKHEREMAHKRLSDAVAELESIANKIAQAEGVQFDYCARTQA